MTRMATSEAVIDAVENCAHHSSSSLPIQGAFIKLARVGWFPDNQDSPYPSLNRTSCGNNPPSMTLRSSVCGVDEKLGNWPPSRSVGKTMLQLGHGLAAAGWGQVMGVRCSLRQC